MSKEQMEEARKKVIDALEQVASAHGISDVEALDFKDGDPLPIALVIDGENFVLELNLL